MSKLTIDEVPVTDPYGPLRRREIDVLVYWLAGGEPDLMAGPVIECRARVLAVGCGHRLARRESVSVEDLADEEVHHKPQPFPAAIWDELCPQETPSGRTIPCTRPSRSIEDVAAQISRGRMVHPTVIGTPFLQRDDIRLVPIRDLPSLPLGLVWRTADVNARIRTLAGVARRIGCMTGS